MSDCIPGCDIVPYRFCPRETSYGRWEEVGMWWGGLAPVTFFVTLFCLSLTCLHAHSHILKLPSSF